MAEGRSFRLSNLIPEPLTFTDDAYGGDGRTHDVLTADLLSEADMARMTTLERRMARAAAEERGEDMLQALNELFQMLIPGLSAERVAHIPVTLKTKFFDFWSAQHPKASGVAATPAKPKPKPIAPRRGQRLRGS